MSNCKRIVLTGGPCGGKSTFMQELRANDPYSQKWLFVPEAAPLLFRAGLNGREKRFQRAVMRLQIELEEICAEAAKPGQYIICHRGTLDPLAYWVRNGWDRNEFFKYVQTSILEQYHRYDLVIHLQTVAIGAKEYYTRWPDAHRHETPEESAEIDRLCVDAWNNHPNYHLVNNRNQDWKSKVHSAQNIIFLNLRSD